MFQIISKEEHKQYTTITSALEIKGLGCAIQVSVLLYSVFGSIESHKESLIFVNDCYIKTIKHKNGTETRTIESSNGIMPLEVQRSQESNGCMKTDCFKSTCTGCELNYHPLL